MSALEGMSSIANAGFVCLERKIGFLDSLMTRIAGNAAPVRPVQLPLLYFPFKASNAEQGHVHIHCCKLQQICLGAQVRGVLN